MTGQTSYRRDQVITLINSVIEKVSSPQETSRDMICSELMTLKSMMEDLRSQLGKNNANAVSDTYIPSATDELDAVTGATEAATVSIMQSCEKILKTLESSEKDMRDDIEAEVTHIYEACTFQDIAGQRIAKVVKTMKMIDSKVGALLSVLEGIAPVGGEVPKANSSKSSSAALLNGPQLPGGALTQEEIDRLLDGL